MKRKLIKGNFKNSFAFALILIFMLIAILPVSLYFMQLHENNRFDLNKFSDEIIAEDIADFRTQNYDAGLLKEKKAVVASASQMAELGTSSGALDDLLCEGGAALIYPDSSDDGILGYYVLGVENGIPVVSPVIGGVMVEDGEEIIPDEVFKQIDYSEIITSKRKQIADSATEYMKSKNSAGKSELASAVALSSPMPYTDVGYSTYSSGQVKGMLVRKNGKIIADFDIKLQSERSYADAYENYGWSQMIGVTIMPRTGNGNDIYVVEQFKMAMYSGNRANIVSYFTNSQPGTYTHGTSTTEGFGIGANSQGIVTGNYSYSRTTSMSYSCVGNSLTINRNRGPIDNSTVDYDIFTCKTNAPQNFESYSAVAGMNILMNGADSSFASLWTVMDIEVRGKVFAPSWKLMKPMSVITHGFYGACYGRNYMITASTESKDYLVKEYENEDSRTCFMSGHGLIGMQYGGIFQEP